jgi:phasin family protein
VSKTTTPDPLNLFGDLTKMIEQFKLPGVDMASIVASRSKDMDALLAANKATLESMQELARKQAEIFTKAMQSAQESFGLMAKNGAVPDPVKQNELVRKAYEKAVAQMTELAEMARKAQADAMAGITKRVNESAEQVKKALRTK